MISERLKDLRKEFNVTQNKVANYIGVARATYTNYESGKKKPPYEQLIKLSKFFNVSTDYLLGITNNKDAICKLKTTENTLEFGERIKELRNTRKTTQKEMADILGVDRSTYIGYETDKTKPSYEILLKLADYFSVSIDFLTGREELTPDKKLAILLYDKDMQTAFEDYNNWTVEEKEDLLNYIEFQKMKRNKDKNL